MRHLRSLVFVVLVLCIFLPTITSVPFDPQETSLVIRDVFIWTSIEYLWLSPFVHITTVLLLILLSRYGKSIGRIADAYFGVLFLFFAFSNHIAVTDKYGLAVIAGNLVMVLIVGIFWMWEAYRPKNVYFFPMFLYGDTGCYRLQY